MQTTVLHCTISNEVDLFKDFLSRYQCVSFRLRWAHATKAWIGGKCIVNTILLAGFIEFPLTSPKKNVIKQEVCELCEYMLGLVRLFVNNVTNDPRLFFAIFLVLLHIYKTSFVEFSSREIFRTHLNLERFWNGCGFEILCLSCHISTYKLKICNRIHISLNNILKIYLCPW